MDLILACYTKNYFNFGGRASRKEFWLFKLTSFLLPFTFGMLTIIFSNLIGLETSVQAQKLMLIPLLVLIFSIVPLWSVSVRRLHDINRSGMWLALWLLPFGHLVLIILFCIKGNKELNKYGSPS
ncbi:MAG: DUF805 domain-containing protein [Simkaniaceae bacterium]|jgi:uncharacterized membrane protein YhaH (DUF805 family)